MRDFLALLKRLFSRSKTFAKTKNRENRQPASLLDGHPSPLTEGASAGTDPPRHSVDCYNRGNAYLHEGKLDRAIEEYTKAIAGDPRARCDYRDQLPWALKDKPFDPSDGIYTSPKSFFNRAQAYMQRGEFAEAIEDYTCAVQICPAFASAYANRAAALFRLAIRDLAIGDVAEAESAIVRANDDMDHFVSLEDLTLEMANNLLRIKTELGCLRHLHQRREEALHDFGSAISLSRQLADFIQGNATDARSQAAAKTCLECAQRIRRAMGGSSPASENVAVLRRWIALSIDLGTVFRSLRRIDQAEEIYRRCLWQLTQPDVQAALSGDNGFAQEMHAMAHNYLGMLYLDTGRLDLAAAQFRRAIEIRETVAASRPANVLNRVYLAGALCNCGHTLRGLTKLSEAEKTYDKAARLLRDVLPLCSDDAYLLAQQFQRNVEDGWQVAQSLAKWAAQGFAESESLILETGAPEVPTPVPFLPEIVFPADAVEARECFLQGKLQTAAMALEAWLENNSTRADGWHWKARLEQELGDTAEAMSSVDRAWRLDPDCAATICLRADLLRLTGKTDECLAAVDRLLSDQPDLAAAWHLKGLVLAETASLPVGPPDPQSPPMDGVTDAVSACFAANGLGPVRRFDKVRALAALACFDAALVRNPESYPTRLAKGMLLTRLANAADATSKNAFDYYSRLCGRGQELTELAGRFSTEFSSYFYRALESFEEASDLRPDAPAPYFQKGEFLAEYSGLIENARADAKRALEQSLTRDPDNADAARILAELRTEQDAS